MKARIDNLLLAGAALWCASILAAPALSLTPIYEFFSLICHQQPERSWFLMGQPLPVCIRCAAIYFGFLAALIAKRQPAAVLLKVAIVLTLGEVCFEWLVMDSVVARSFTGLLLGASAAPFVRIGVEQMFGVQSDAL